MRPVQKVMTTMLWACAVVALVSVIGANMLRDRAAGPRYQSEGSITITPSTQGAAAAAGDDQPLRLAREIPGFTLVDQNSRPVTLESLEGTPFVANFVFTNCAGPCPVMTAKMAGLQEALPAEIKLVSFSVDPRRDRPDVLKKYAGDFKADHSRWHFLTVADPKDADTIYTLSQAVLLPAAPAAGEQGQVIHSQKFVLVDETGTIRSYYDSDSAAQMTQLVADAKDLLAARQTPKQ